MMIYVRTIVLPLCAMRVQHPLTIKIVRLECRDFTKSLLMYHMYNGQTPNSIKISTYFYPRKARNSK